MTELATLANWAELVGAAVVVGGVVFAVVEIRNFQRQRLEALSCRQARMGCRSAQAGAGASSAAREAPARAAR